MQGVNIETQLGVNMYREIVKHKASRVLLVGSLGLASLVGCTSGGSSPAPASTPATQPPIEAICTPDHPERWSPIPPNLNIEEFARKLVVPLNDIAQGGRFGGATCDKPVAIDRVSTPHGPVVAVTGEGQPCLVIGTQAPPAPHTMITKVLAICATGSSTQA
jgi:hypothetical protein